MLILSLSRNPHNRIALFDFDSQNTVHIKMHFPLAERIFVGRSHVAKVAEARLEQLNRYCQVHMACIHRNFEEWNFKS